MADLAALQVQIQALENQLQAQQALINAIPGQPPAPGAFALTPALAFQDVIDYSTSSGLKLYKAATTPMDPPYNGTAANLSLFLEAIKKRATNFGWTGILTISDQAQPTPSDRDLITQHRMLSIDNVQHAARNNYLGQQTRDAQSSHLLFEFLYESLDEATKKTMMTESSKYMLTVNNTTYKDGPSFLKAILLKVSVETNATDFHIRENLHELPAKIKELDYNIQAFNDYVKVQVTDLAAGGQETTDLLVYLFLSYESVKDDDFQQYIKRKKEEYDEGTPITPNALMDLALVKYNQLNQSKTWGVPSEAEKKIVALSAQLEEAQTQLKRALKQSSKSSKGNAKGQTSSEGKKDKDNSNAKGTSWRKQKPPPGQTKRKHKGKEFTWCSFHKYWCDHDVNSCRAKKKAERKKKEKDKDHKDDSSSNNQDESLQLAQALIDDDDTSFHE
jgi:hypothetical protein